MNIERSSLILRTNPHLTGNAKLVLDSEDKLHLDSIQVNDILSNAKFSKIINPSSDYTEDLYSLFNSVPKDIFFEIGKLSDDKIYSSCSEQFESTYTYGTSHCTSKLYEEQFKIFAPLLIGKKMPKYFCIFKVDGAKHIKYKHRYGNHDLVVGAKYKILGKDDVTITHAGTDYKVGDSFVAIDDSFVIHKEYEEGDAWCVVEDQNYESNFDFFKDFISPSNLIKIIDIENGNLGKYIKNLQSNPLFSRPPIYVNYEDKRITYTGISVNKGGIISVQESIESLMETEKPIKLFDEYITEGFYRNNLVLPNLINIEFMFNDGVSKDFETNRYYGFYTDDVDFYSFPQEDLKTLLENQSNILSSSSGYFYIKNVYDNIIKINNQKSIEENYREINTKENINYVFDSQAKVDFLSNRGISQTNITLNSKLPIGFEIRVYLGDKYVESIVADTLKNLVEGDYGYDKWKNDGQLMTYFNPEGSETEVLLRMGKAIKWILDAVKNYSYKFAVYQNKLYIYSSANSEPTLSLVITNKNKGEIKLESETLIGYTTSKNHRFKIKKIDESIYKNNCYIKTISGKYAKVSSITDYLDEIEIVDGIIINPELVELYSVVSVDYNTDPIQFNGDYISIYRKKNLGYGCFNICNIEDFDFDFYSESYTSSYENEYSHYYNTRSGNLEIGKWYHVHKSPNDIDEAKVEVIDNKGKPKIVTSPSMFVAYSKDYKIISGNPIIIDNSYYNDEELLNFVGFNCVKPRDYSYKKIENLEEKIDSFPKKSNNEYEILKENLNQDFAYLSKTTPYINKWVMKEKDIRENNYRLNLSPSFGKNSFSPSFDVYTPDPLNFTSEWYYLSSYPADMTDEEIYNSTSYFDHIFDIKLHSSFNYDYFSDYFTVNRCNQLVPCGIKYKQDENGDYILDGEGNKIIDYDDFGIPKQNYAVSVKQVKYQKRYSIIEKVTTNPNDDNYQTFFRGVRINFNSPKNNLDGYKFSVIMNVKRTVLDDGEDQFSIAISRNDKFKNITVVLTIHVDDYKILDKQGHIHCGYLYLYIMNHLRTWDADYDEYIYGMKFRMKNYTNQIVKIGKFDKPTSQLQDFNNSILYGSKFYFTVGTKYADEHLVTDEHGITTKYTNLQFEDDKFNLLDWYGLNHNGKYPDLIGLRGDYVLFTKPVAYDFAERFSLIDMDKSNIIGYDKTGIKLDKLGEYIENSQNRRVSTGGIAIASSTNYTPIVTKMLKDLRKIVQIANMNWIEIYGGYNYYSKLSSFITFSSIINFIHNKSNIVKYYRCDNGEYWIDREFGDVTFIKPTEITQTTTLKYVEDNKILPEHPSELILNYKLQEVKNKEVFYRYSGGFYPKTTTIFSFSDLSRELSWEEEMRMWKQVSKQWKGYYNDGDFFIDYKGEYTSGKDINSGRLYRSWFFDEKNFIISSNPILRNVFYHKISPEGNNIINTDLSAYEDNKEINIDKKDINLFKTMFDVDQFVEYPKSIKEGKEIASYNDYDNIKTYFGSVLTKLPYKFILGDYKSFIDETLSTPDVGITYSVNVSSSDDKTVRFIINLGYAFYEKIKNEIYNNLSPYINENYIKNKDLDQYIKNYCIQNLFKNYIIEKISFYIKDNGTKSLPIIVSEDNELTLLKVGYTKEKNVTISNLDSSTNQVTVTYKLKNQNYSHDNYSYGILFNLKIK